MPEVKQPQDRRTAASKRREKQAASDELDRGIAVTDADGARLQVRIRNVKGVHDARLVQLIGLDFLGLLEALQKRQGLDLFAATLWFARLVNGRGQDSTGEPIESYADILNRFGYEDFLAMDADEPEAVADGPKASASSSSSNSPA